VTCEFQNKEQRWHWQYGGGQLMLTSNRYIGRCLGLSPDTEKNGTLLAPLPCSDTDSVDLWHTQL
jgi:hypothetical protein